MKAYIYIYKYHNIMILNDRWVESSSWGLGNINQFMETECSF